MKKTIQATSKLHKWSCGEMFRVQRFLDAGGRTRFQIVRSHKWARLVLISKRAIKAIANDEYIFDDIVNWYRLQVNSPFGVVAYGYAELRQIIRVAKCIMRELKIK